MKIAITGGAGFIGSHLTRAYLDAGHDVVVIDTLVNGSDSAKQSLDPRARFYSVDIRDGRLSTILQQERPDIVSHHAGQREPIVPTEQALIDADLHVRGLLNVLDACISASVSKLIFASAGNSLYGRVDADTLPLKEDATLCPRCPSDISKVAGEWYVRYFTRQYGLTHTILRYADVYGDLESERVQHPVSYFVKMLLEQQRSVIRGTGRDGRDSLFVDDVVRANLRALERGKNLTLHISSGLAYNLNQFFYASARLLHSEQKPVYVSGSLAEPTTIALDNTLAQEVLGWHPEITFSEGIRRLVEGVQWRLSGSTSQSPQVYTDEVLKGATQASLPLPAAPLRPSKEAVYALSAAKETEYRTLAAALA